MGQARKTRPYADAALSDLETNLRNLQAEINRRLATMDRDPLHAFTNRAGVGGTARPVTDKFDR